MLTADTHNAARLAGWAYLAIILAGVSSEAVLRAGILVPQDPAQTAIHIAAEESRFRLGMLFDAVMVLCDVALAVLLYRFFRPVDAAVALAAMVFRLVQAAVLAGNLMMASGLSRIGEVFNRITSGEAERGIAHATSGPCLQHNLVTVLEKA